MNEVIRKSQHNPLLTGLYAALPVAAAAVLGNVATIPNIPVWYASLAKPSFNPPNWIFGPVWTLLFIMMAYAFYCILRLPHAMAGRRLAIGLFLIQMALNALWSWAFFAAHNPLAGLIVIVCLWMMIAATIVSFFRLARTAGALLVPYILWVSFALVLNAAIFRLNA